MPYDDYRRRDDRRYDDRRRDDYDRRRDDWNDDRRRDRDDRYSDDRRDWYGDARRDRYEEDRRDRYEDDRRARERERERARDSQRERDDDRDRMYDRATAGSVGQPAASSAAGKTGTTASREADAAAREAAAKEAAAAAAAKKAKEEEEYQARVAEQMAEVEEDDEEAEERRLAERRRKRAEIAARHAAQQQQTETAASTAVGASACSGSKVDPNACSSESISSDLPSGGPVACGAAAPAGSCSQPSASLPSTPAGGKPSSYLPAATEDAHMGEAAVEVREDSESEEEAPAPVHLNSQDANPLSDEAKRKEAELRKYLLDHRRRTENVEGKSNPGCETAQATSDQPEQSGARLSNDVGNASGTNPIASARKGDDGGFDMFSDAFDEPVAEAMEELVDEAALMDRGDNYDDKEGYYAHRVGDILNDRYKVSYLAILADRMCPMRPLLRSSSLTTLAVS